MTDRRRERVARAIYDAVGPSSASLSDLPSTSPPRVTAYAAADAAIAALDGKTTAVTRFIGRTFALAATAAITLLLAGVVVALVRWIW